MPTLEWIGKNKVVNHHQEVPFRVLERQYSFDEQGQHIENNGSENMIISKTIFFITNIPFLFYQLVYDCHLISQFIQRPSIYLSNVVCNVIE